MKIPSELPVRYPFQDNYFYLMEICNMAFVVIAKNDQGVCELTDPII